MAVYTKYDGKDKKKEPEESYGAPVKKTENGIVFGNDPKTASSKYGSSSFLDAYGSRLNYGADPVLEKAKSGDFVAGDIGKSDSRTVIDMTPTEESSARSAYNRVIGSRPTWDGGKYGAMLDDAVNQILNRKPFQYDLNGDMLYQQYKDQYLRQGNLAMQDTMGKAAALTGGYGNSYAQTAGQQTYNGFIQELNDRIPELYGLALDKYKAENERLGDNYSILRQAYGDEYDRYADQYNQWADEADRAYTEYNDSMNRALSMVNTGDKTETAKDMPSSVSKLVESAIANYSGNELNSAIEQIASTYPQYASQVRLYARMNPRKEEASPLKEPDDKIYKGAEEAFLNGGSEELDKFIARYPGYDSEKVYDYISEYVDTKPEKKNLWDWMKSTKLTF